MSADDFSEGVELAGTRNKYGERIETWIDEQPQRQDSLTDQLTDLHRVAARLGMYDAADWLWKAMRDRGTDR